MALLGEGTRRKREGVRVSEEERNQKRKEEGRSEKKKGIEQSIPLVPNAPLSFL